MKTKRTQLRVKKLSINIGNKKILEDVSFDVNQGSVHVVMGPNGSGKSTIANALMGHPEYTVSSPLSKMILNGTDMTGMETDKRARLGLFLAFQSPIAIPGVSVLNLIRSACESMSGDGTTLHGTPTNNPVLMRRSFVGDVGIVDFIGSLKAKAKELSIPESLLSRSVHEGFSGGERKKIEILTACMLKPKYAVFDEIDTGLDVDALRVVAGAIVALAKQGTGVIVITHYQRLLKYLTPDVVHVLVAGRIVKQGTAALARRIEAEGYARYIRA